jgi:hypothetical protein
MIVWPAATVSCVKHWFKYDWEHSNTCKCMCLNVCNKFIPWPCSISAFIIDLRVEKAINSNGMFILVCMVLDYYVGLFFYLI